MPIFLDCFSLTLTHIHTQTHSHTTHTHTYTYTNTHKPQVFFFKHKAFRRHSSKTDKILQWVVVRNSKSIKNIAVNQYNRLLEVSLLDA